MTTERPNKLFPLFVTDKLQETKAFYTEKLGFSVVFDMPNYLQLRYGERDVDPELCFMRPDAFPDGKPRAAYAGDGVLVSVPTGSADAKYREVTDAGAATLEEPGDKPWGWRSFTVRDPNGVVIDFFHVNGPPPTT